MIDYKRGVDVVQWEGPVYVPSATATPSSARLPATAVRAASRSLPNTSASASLPRAALLVDELWLVVIGGLAALAHRRRP